MSKTTFTKQQRKEYFESLRLRFSQAKLKINKYNDKYIQACEYLGSCPSQVNFTLISEQLEEKGLTDYVPYVDVLTFNSWKSKGFKVKKGEKALASGVTFLNFIDEDKENNENKEHRKTFMMPKSFVVFGKHQVEEM